MNIPEDKCINGYTLEQFINKFYTGRSPVDLAELTGGKVNHLIVFLYLFLFVLICSLTGIDSTTEKSIQLGFKSFLNHH